MTTHQRYSLERDLHYIPVFFNLFGLPEQRFLMGRV